MAAKPKPKPQTPSGGYKVQVGPTKPPFGSMLKPDKGAAKGKGR